MHSLTLIWALVISMVSCISVTFVSSFSAVVCRVVRSSLALSTVEVISCLKVLSCCVWVWSWELMVATNVPCSATLFMTSSKLSIFCVKEAVFSSISSIWGGVEARRSRAG